MLSSISLGRYCRKSLAKSGGSEEKIKWEGGGDHIGRCLWKGEGRSALLHTMEGPSF